MLITLLLAGVALPQQSSSVASPALPVRPCESQHFNTIQDMDRAMSLRAISIVALARDTSPESEGVLEQQVAPNAQFGLGMGDMGMSVPGHGVSALRSFARTLGARHYEFEGRKGITGPPMTMCDYSELVVRFTDTEEGVSTSVTFKFVDGKLASAFGWKVSFASGDVQDVR